LAYIVLLIRAEHGGGAIWATVGQLIAFVLVMVYVVQRLLRRFESKFRESGSLSDNVIALMLLLALVAALFTERIGIHLLFGAFLMDAIMPKEQRFVRYVLDRFETIVVTLLLPLFFAFTGLVHQCRPRQRPGDVDVLRHHHPNGQPWANLAAPCCPCGGWGCPCANLPALAP
jgi:Kef-type K+ transport system membrane component KefB